MAGDLWHQSCPSCVRAGKSANLGNPQAALTCNLLTRKPHSPATCSLLMPRRFDRMDAWLERLLGSIAGCSASGAERSMADVSMSQIITNSDEGNRQLQDLIIWLENHAIRQWKVDDRRALGDNFDDAFERYLTDLDCPAEYRESSGNTRSVGGNNCADWKANPESRGKIVFWVVSNAISETYLDQRPSGVNNDNNVSSQVDETEKVADEQQDLNKIVDKDSFPLGFSTNDADIDGIIMALRMKYLLDLRRVQNKVNESVAEMQKLTVKK